jgi:type IV pilus assembly protein PilA
MKKFKKKGFTLIELIAVLVIMAILALIATPLVMSIIRKARVSADKRSVDAYGRSIELAIAGYLLDNGKFPTDISQLTIEYSGDEVVCETTQINPDSSVYLAGCKVKGRDVTNYTYGSDKSPSYKVYNIGDEVTYNNVNYYVIKDSDSKESTVTLLKAEPLTAEEITTYSAGTGAQTDGNGGMQYGTSNDYSNSYIKITVDAWKNANAPESIDVRLISKEEIDDNFEFEEYNLPCGGGCIYKVERISETWMYNSNYDYWTMSSKSDTSDYIWFMTKDGFFESNSVNNPGYFSTAVRPVIVLDKSVLPI